MFMVIPISREEIEIGAVAIGANQCKLKFCIVKCYTTSIRMNAFRFIEVPLH